MRYRFAVPFMLAITLPCLTGCDETVKERLQGKWIGESADGFPAHQQRSTAGWLNGSSFEFQGSRVSVTLPAESPRQGTFKVTEESARTFSVSFMRATGETDAAAFDFEKDDRLRWKMDDGRSIVLKKVN